MKVVNCENLYTHCAVNCYPHCFDHKHELVCFATRNSLAFYDLNKLKIVSLCCAHKDVVNSVRWIAGTNDKHLISSSVDKTCVIWQKVGPTEEYGYEAKHTLSGHTDSVIVADSILHTATSSFISVSSCNDQSVRYWKDDTCFATQNVKCFIFDAKLYQNLTIIPGIVVLTAGSNELVTIQRLNVECGQVDSLLSIKGHGDWIKTLDLVQHNDSLMLASGSQDFVIRVYNIKQTTDEDVSLHQQTFSITSDQGKSIQYVANLETVLCGHEGWVTEVKWHLAQQEEDNDNKLHLLSSSMDKTIILWEPLDDIWNEAIRFGEVGGNAIGFLGCCSIPARGLITGYSFTGAVNFWRRPDGVAAAAGQWKMSVPITGHFNEVTDLAWEPAGEYFLTCSTDQTTRLHSYWKQSGGGRVTWHEISRPQIHGYDLKCIAMAGRLKFVSGADEKVIRIFNATKYFIDSWRCLTSSSGDEATSFESEGDGEQIADCAVVPALGLSNSAVYDSSQIGDEMKPKVTASPPTEEILLQNTLWPESQKLYGHGYELFAVAVNSDATLLASACKASSVAHAAVILWNLKSFKKVAHLSSHSLTVTQVRFSPNDRYLLSVSRDRTWALFDMHHEYARVAYSDKRSGVHSRIIWDCAWTPDSKAFLTAARDKSVVLWTLGAESVQDGGGDSAAGQQQQHALQVTSVPQVLALEESTTSVDVHSNFTAPYLACVALENGKMAMYSFSLAGEWSLMYSFDGQGHTHTINRIRFSPKTTTVRKDETGAAERQVVQLASCSSDRSVKLFQIDLELN